VRTRSNETQDERRLPGASADRSESVLIMENVNGQRAGVRSIAWLDVSRGISRSSTQQ
jgi:hypothetical protein